MDGTNLLIWIVQSVILAFILLTGFAYVTLLERRVVARFQSRVGPNRVGPYGLLQPLADGVKLIFKEEVIPDLDDKWTFILAPLLAAIPAIVVFAVIPLGGTIYLGDLPIPLTIAPGINVGLLYVLAISGIRMACSAGPEAARMVFTTTSLVVTIAYDGASTPAILGVGGWQAVRPYSATTAVQSPIADRSFTGAPVTNKN